jgi:branched-chain amino acid aminotransferase
MKNTHFADSAAGWPAPCADPEEFAFGVERNPAPVPPGVREQLLESPGFGQVFSDHMASALWTRDAGWKDWKVTARRPFQIDPASAVLHYAQEVFEGLKAYRVDDCMIALFRPEQNARRLNASAARLAMPPVPEALFLNAVDALVRADSDWVPRGEASLYLRPFLFASEPVLSLRPANQYVFCIIASPVGSYFQGGTKALSLWVCEDRSRASPGGTGAAKCGGNYASSLVSQAEAQEQGCDQVVFLDAVEQRWVEELGGMNIFFVFDDGSVLTPPLGGTILPGITRASIIALLAQRGVRVREEPYAIDQWRRDCQSGRLCEAFACGTAALVTPIGRVKSRSGDWQIGSGAGGDVAEHLRTALTAIQRGRTKAPEGWLRRVEL